MKPWIKKQLREGLEEMSPVAKSAFGDSATQHGVYKSQRNPNVLYKAGNKDTVLRWVRIFKKYPDLFPRIFKVAQNHNEPDTYYVEIEKLNTAKAVQEWQYMNDKLDETSIFEHFGVGDIDGLFVTAVEDFDVDNNIKLAIKKYKPEIYSMFVKWLTFLTQLEHVVGTEDPKSAGADIHRYNFAYDNAGNIKCIDT